jgi:predicted ATPase
MLDAGRLLPSFEGWKVASADLDKLALPANLLELISGRIASLAPSTTFILGTAAVLGSPFSIDLLHEVGAAGAENINTALAEATRARVIHRPGEDRYAFVHDQLQEALLGRLQPLDQKRLHQQLADRLSRDPAQTSEHIFALAHHSGRGELERDPAVYRANLAAAARALNEHSNEQALEFLQTAKAARELSSGHAELEFLELSGTACARTGAWPNRSSSWTPRWCARTTPGSGSSFERGWPRPIAPPSRS